MDNQTNETGIYGGILMKTALEKILEYKVKDGRMTSQSDKEQWTCLQKIIAINKLIVDYHNAFVELKESYQDLLDRYNVINAEWDVLKTDMEAIASEWTQFKPLVNQIINLWENTITPTFEEWTTLMNNWGNTMNGYASTMADYQQTMMEISQSFQNIENEWSAITLAVRGNYEIENVTPSADLDHPTVLKYNIEDYNDIIIIASNESIKGLIELGNTPISRFEESWFDDYNGWSIQYKGSAGENNSVFEYYTPSKVGVVFSDPTDNTISFLLNTESSGDAMIFKRHIPYFSADQSSEVQEALTRANEAVTKANEANTTATNAQSSATSAMQSAQNALTKCGQLESGKMSNKIVDCITSDMSTLSETRSYNLKVDDPNMFVYVEGIPNTDSGYLCCTIPMISIPKTTQSGTAGGRRYQLTDEANYFSFTLAFNDVTSTLYITFSTRAKAEAKITRVALYG